MKTINNFIFERSLKKTINEKLKLTNQSKLNNKKKFSDLERGDIIYKMILHGNAFSDIYSCTIINIDNHEHYEDVIVDYTCKNNRYYAVFSRSSFYDYAFNYILIDSNHTDIYYFINKDVAKKVQTTHISNSIKKLQDELSKLKDPTHPNYRKNVNDREWQIKELEKELNVLIEQSNKYNDEQ